MCVTFVCLNCKCHQFYQICHDTMSANVYVGSQGRVRHYGAMYTPIAVLCTCEGSPNKGSPSLLEKSHVSITSLYKMGRKSINAGIHITNVII